MTSHLNSHRTTDIKLEMLSGVQTSNGTLHDKYNICGIAHAWTNRKHDIFMQRRLVQNFTPILEWGKGLVYWRSTHSAGHTPGIFSLHAASPLCGIFIWGGQLLSKYFWFKKSPNLIQEGVGSTSFSLNFLNKEISDIRNYLNYSRGDWHSSLKIYGGVRIQGLNKNLFSRILGWLAKTMNDSLL